MNLIMHRHFMIFRKRPKVVDRFAGEKNVIVLGNAGRDQTEENVTAGKRASCRFDLNVAHLQRV